MKKIGIIGHVDHGKTTLASAVAVAAADIRKEVIIVGAGHHEGCEAIDSSTKITATPMEIPIWDDFKSGKESRRARRKKERKNKK